MLDSTAKWHYMHVWTIPHHEITTAYKNCVCSKVFFCPETSPVTVWCIFSSDHPWSIAYRGKKAISLSLYAYVSHLPTGRKLFPRHSGPCPVVSQHTRLQEPNFLVGGTSWLFRILVGGTGRNVPLLFHSVPDLSNNRKHGLLVALFGNIS